MPQYTVSWKNKDGAQCGQTFIGSLARDDAQKFTKELKRKKATHISTRMVT